MQGNKGEGNTDQQICSNEKKTNPAASWFFFLVKKQGILQKL